ncbi:MAG: hypothetical protein BGO72_14965 [Burkholderiales bacterium 70-64]|nr:MAG: hypothetical protein BGO72_14965 [Burkholderiales bacterium 70-64]
MLRSWPWLALAALAVGPAAAQPRPDAGAGAPAGAAAAAAPASPASPASPSSPFEDTLAQRLRACSACHGAQGRATRDGYFPRIAGKPAGYLFNQLRSFRDGRRHYPAMAGLLAQMSDAYLHEIAGYFAALQLPYPPPQAAALPEAALAQARVLVFEGDPARELPACAQCHGRTLTGTAPAIPGLLGLSRDYLNAQFGAWRDGLRHAAAPDCMARIAGRLRPEEIGVLSRWLAAQPLPANTTPQPRLPADPPMRCGSLAGEDTAAPARAPAALRGDAGDAREARDARNVGDEVVRGAYLAAAGNCAGCHAAPDGTPFAGGRGVVTPFGTVYAPNLTPDDETGLGRWRSDDFWRAMHEGRSQDGRALYPAFPYPQYTHIDRKDADAIFAFLRSLAPVRRANRPHALRFPFDRPLVLEAWRWLFFRPAAFVPEPTRSAEWNRGAYLVSGLGHCASCHARRNVFGATKDPGRFDGETMPALGWYAPSLHAPGQAGVQHWPVERIVALLRDGVAPGAGVAGPMAEVVYSGTQHLSEADLRAVATYLKALPAEPAAGGQGERGRGDGAAGADRRFEAGARLYRSHCADCHGRGGEGVPRAYPPLAGNRAVTLDPPVNLVRVVAHGGFAPTTAGNPRPFGMPPFTQALDDAQLAAVLSYVRNAWGNRAAPLSSADVGRYRGSAGQ